ncbi:MAG: CDP-archaeol synthase [Patescibacteria group bacterium]|nr:CDP-archaeol synthase [Patescibacteria group bacterium]
MFQFILSCLYFFSPAYFVNMTPPLIKRVGLFNFLDKPVDFNRKFKGAPILGSHKTWRGVIFGILMGFLIVFLQAWLYPFSAIQKISLLDYSQINIFIFGFLISLGAVFGDLIFAFIKRRLKLEPGARFLPFDQTNYVIGAFIFLQPILKLNPSIWFTIFISTFFLHLIFNRVGYWLRLHKNKW